MSLAALGLIVLSIALLAAGAADEKGLRASFIKVESGTRKPVGPSTAQAQPFGVGVDVLPVAMNDLIG